MRYNKKKWTLVLILVLFNTARTENLGSLEDKTYDPAQLPREVPVEVSFVAQIFDISNVDERTHTFTVEMDLLLLW